MKVAVGSTNPVKLESARQAFVSVWPDQSWQVVGAKVLSGVSDQPMSDAESIDGARQRAVTSRQQTAADYGIGLEGGLQQTEGHWLECGWVVVVGPNEQEGVGSTCRMEMPPPMLAEIKAGDELGVVIDRHFGRQKISQQEGFFGIMTGGAIDRTAAYRDGIIFALSRFIHPALFAERA